MILRDAKPKGRVTASISSREAVENAIDLSKEDGTMWEEKNGTPREFRRTGNRKAPVCTPSAAAPSQQKVFLAKGRLPG